MKNTHLINEWAIWAGLAIFAVALVVIPFLVNFDVYFLMVTPLLVIIGVPGSIIGALIGKYLSKNWVGIWLGAILGEILAFWLFFSLVSNMALD